MIFKTIKNLLYKIKKLKKGNKNLPKVDSPYSNWAKILFYMKNKNIADASDFMQKGKWWFVGYNANARLSELKALGYVKKVGEKITQKETFGRKKKVKIYIFEITLKGRVRAKYLANKL